MNRVQNLDADEVNPSCACHRDKAFEGLHLVTVILGFRRLPRNYGTRRNHNSHGCS